jgi:hypothetical protein
MLRSTPTLLWLCNEEWVWVIQGLVPVELAAVARCCKCTATLTAVRVALDTAYDCYLEHVTAFWLAQDEAERRASAEATAFSRIFPALQFSLLSS